jgi:hypothetical protein
MDQEFEVESVSTINDRVKQEVIVSERHSSCGGDDQKEVEDDQDKKDEFMNFLKQSLDKSRKKKINKMTNGSKAKFLKNESPDGKIKSLGKRMKN